MKKRIFTTLLALSMITVLTVGCSSNADTTSATTNETEEAGTKEENSDTAQDSTSTADSELQAIIDAGVLKVGCKADVPSFGLQNTEKGEFEGLEVDLSYAVAAKIFGVTDEEAKEKKLVEFQGVTAKTRGALLDNGEIDMVAATFTITEERKESWNFSTPYMQDAIGLMCLKAAGYETMQDLDGAIIGVAQGSTTKDAVENYIQEQGLGITVEYQEFDGYPALSAALVSGNIDIFAVDRAILAGYNDDTTMILSERFGTQDYGVATALYAEELTEIVDQVVNEMLDSGEMNQLIEKWGIE
jgi:putative glutamine transport system substrate-binding protein